MFVFKLLFKDQAASNESNDKAEAEVTLDKLTTLQFDSTARGIGEMGEKRKNITDQIDRNVNKYYSPSLI